MARCVVLLQNAWSPAYAGDVWPRQSWLPALHDCVTGRRLARIFPPPADGVWFDNTTPMVSPEPNGVCPPDRGHVARLFREQAPQFVLACGKQAEKVARELWTGRLICMPHPAWRFMTPFLLDAVRALIATDRFYRVRCISTGMNATAFEEIP